MNLFFLDLIQGSKKEKRESITDSKLPNGNFEGILYEAEDNQYSILKNGRLILGYCCRPFFYVEFVPENKREIYIVAKSDCFHFHFYSLESGGPFEVSGTQIKLGFSSCLEIINFDLIPFIRRKNFVKRTITSTFIDSLIKIQI